MKKNINKTLESFLDLDKEEVKDNVKFISQRDGLIERIDKKLVTESGKQLLKEQLYESTI